jgi:hypothetical protein
MVASDIQFTVDDSVFAYARINSSLRLLCTRAGTGGGAEAAAILPQCSYGDFHDGIALALDNVLDGYGYINSKGLFITPMQYIAAEDFSEERAFVTDDASTKLIDTTGTVIRDYHTILITGPFSEGLALVAKIMNETAGEFKRDAYVDRSGAFVVDFGEPDEISSPEIISDEDACSEGLIRVHSPACCERKFGFMDTGRHIRIPLMYEDATRFSMGMAAVMKDGKYVFIDAHNRQTIEARYDDARTFTEGLAAVRRNGAWGYIDRKGNIAIDMMFEKAEQFKDGSARVKIADKYGIIDPTGRYLVRPVFDGLTNFHHGVCRIKFEGKHGVMNRDGAMLFEG